MALRPRYQHSGKALTHQKTMPRKANPKNNYVPTDYADLYSYYMEGDSSLAANIVRKISGGHATDDEIETLVHDAFVRLMRFDMLAKFDPAKANFGGMIYFAVRSVTVNHLAQKSRNPLTGLNAGSIIESDGNEDRFEPGTYSLDRVFGQVDREDERLAAKELLEEIFAWARGLAANPSSKRDRSLIRVLEMMAEDRNPDEMAPVLGVATSTISGWMRFIRDHARQLRTV